MKVHKIIRIIEEMPEGFMQEEFWPRFFEEAEADETVEEFLEKEFLEEIENV